MILRLVKVVEGGIREQTRRVIETMKAVLEENGNNLDNVLKMRRLLS